MTTAFEELKTKDTTKLREKLYNHLGQAEYFRRRNVSKPITPKKQEFIRKVLQNRVTKLPSTKSKKKLCGNKFKSVRKVFLLVLQIVNLVSQLIYFSSKRLTLSSKSSLLSLTIASTKIALTSDIPKTPPTISKTEKYALIKNIVAFELP